MSLKHWKISFQICKNGLHMFMFYFGGMAISFIHNKQGCSGMYWGQHFLNFESSDVSFVSWV